MKNKTIFLDRDGTINIDYDHVHKIEDFHFIDGVIDALNEFKKMGYKLVIVTNQSGIARGKFTEEQFLTLTEWMDWSLADRGIDIDGIYYCPHMPDFGCQCRKPNPGMLLKAKEKLNIDMASSYIVGDKLSDLLAGRAAGVGTTVFVKSGHSLTPEIETEADFVLEGLKDLPDLIKQRKE